ncbi:dolichol kinase isoform X1 [Ostrinia nubilalis]|uniref:dolichol kinase isoform X1 n=2 Tax=Ostrinia nubilalis TaxID=29057 RepID=UPI0030824BC5
MEEFIEHFVSRIENSNFYKFFRSIDAQVSRNVKAAEIETRQSKSNGLWCCCLLPMILLIYTVQYNVSPLYKLVAFASISLLFYCLLFTVFLSISSLILQEPIYGGCVSTSLVSVLLMYTFLGHDLTFSTIFSVPTVFLYSWLLRTFLNSFQNTFTIGEAMVMAQAIMLFAVMAVAKLTCELDETDEEMDFVYTIIYTVLSTVGLIVTALFLLKDERRNMKSLTYIFGLGAAFGLLMLISLLGVSCITDILHYIFVENDRYQIFSFWLVLVVIAVAVLTMRTQLAVKASTVTRKSFHVLASVVFLSGILVDVNLMVLASGIGFGLLVLVEALRKSNIEPISSALQSAFLVYSDEKDSGCFAMTPIYLYLGLACPLALVPHYKNSELELLSGVLAIGVGDTAASWFGSKYGFNKWSGGNRTYEGTVFNILSQIATVYVLIIFELLNTKNALIRTSIAASITGLVEAKTNQVDNLVLPLVMMIAFQSTSFLR